MQQPLVWISLSFALRRENFKFVLVFIPLSYLFICRNGKENEICTNLEHLDVFYSQRCYIPGIYHLNK